MHLRAAVINDLSGLGRCSLTADIAVLAAMGIEACPLPTAVLTAQTGYEGYHSVSLASHMEAYRRHWNALGITFAGILSGYLASPEAAYQTAEFVDTFHHTGVTYLCDPVLGDQGRVYKGFTDAFHRSHAEPCGKGRFPHAESYRVLPSYRYRNGCHHEPRKRR